MTDWPINTLISIIKNEGTLRQMPFTLGEAALRDDHFIFPLVQGRELVRRIHINLYSKLPRDLSSREEFIPHVTFGRRAQDCNIKEVVERATRLVGSQGGYIDGIVLESIGANEESLVEFDRMFPEAE